MTPSSTFQAWASIDSPVSSNKGKKRGCSKFKIPSHGVISLKSYQCEHWESSEGFYDRLEKEVQNAFIRNLCLQLKDLFEVFNMIPDPPNGCDPNSNSANWYESEVMIGTVGTRMCLNAHLCR